MIRWCLYLKHVSGSGYDMLRESGVIRLPSHRTLRDYTSFTKATVGFSEEVDQQSPLSMVLLALVRMSAEEIAKLLNTGNTEDSTLQTLLGDYFYSPTQSNGKLYYNY